VKVYCSICGTFVYEERFIDFVYPTFASCDACVEEDRALRRIGEVRQARRLAAAKSLVTEERSKG